MRGAAPRSLVLVGGWPPALELPALGGDPACLCPGQPRFPCSTASGLRGVARLAFLFLLAEDN